METQNSALDKIEFNTKEGKPTTLSAYTNKVVLIVNVASKCGLTGQYAALEKMFEKYRENGFVILGFPANNFGAQEPGSTTEIQEFCSLNFGVQFPVLEKISVKGDDQHPLYKQLTKAQATATKNSSGEFEKKLSQHGLLNAKPGEITWNFEKFLINRKGKVIARFAPDITPDDPIITKAIETELAH